MKTALTVAFTLALLSLAGFAADGPHEPDVPYDNVSNYSYPYLVPGPPILAPSPTPRANESNGSTLDWWNQFDGGKESREEEPSVVVVWMVKPAQPGIYWKDKTYDYYSGWNWSSAANGSHSSVHGNSSVPFQVLRVLNEGNHTIQLVKPGTGGSYISRQSLAVEVEEGGGARNLSRELSCDEYADCVLRVNVTANQTALLEYNATFYPLDYVNESAAGSSSEIAAGLKEQNTQLPAIDPALAQLARNLTDPSLSLLMQAEKDRAWVNAWVEYDLFWASNETIPYDAEMANWTFTHRKGICAHYATLYAVIARLQGIPSRIATGFAGGYVSENASYIFPSYGHAWAESYIPPYGWMPFDPTGNVSALDNLPRNDSNSTPENQTKTKIEWSDAGKVTIDLQFTLNRTFEDVLRKKIKKEVEEEMKRNGSFNERLVENETEQRMHEFLERLANFSAQNATPGGLNGTPWDGNGGNFTLPGNGTSTPPSANLTDRGNWTGLNQSENDGEGKNGTPHGNSANTSNLEHDLLNSTKRENGFSQTVSNAAGMLASNALLIFGVLLAFALALAVAGAARDALTARAAAHKTPAGAKLFREVDIQAVERECKRRGNAGEYDEAIVYGYNELADYISYVFRVLNEPSKTAREFAAEFGATRADVDALKTITYLFEMTRYANETTRADYEEFMEALAALSKKRGRK